MARFEPLFLVLPALLACPIPSREVLTRDRNEGDGGGAVDTGDAASGDVDAAPAAPDVRVDGGAGPLDAQPDGQAQASDGSADASIREGPCIGTGQISLDFADVDVRRSFCDVEVSSGAALNRQVDDAGAVLRAETPEVPDGGLSHARGSVVLWEADSNTPFPKRVRARFSVFLDPLLPEPAQIRGHVEWFKLLQDVGDTTGKLIPGLGFLRDDTPEVGSTLVIDNVDRAGDTVDVEPQFYTVSTPLANWYDIDFDVRFGNPGSLVLTVNGLLVDVSKAYRIEQSPFARRLLLVLGLEAAGAAPSAVLYRDVLVTTE